MRGKRDRDGVYRFARRGTRVPFIGYVASLLPLSLGFLMTRTAFQPEALGEGVSKGETIAWGLFIFFSGVFVVLWVSMARLYEFTSEGLNLRSRMGLGRRQSFLWRDIRGFRLETYNWGTKSSRSYRHHRLCVLLKNGDEEVIDSQIDHPDDVQGALSALRSRGYRVERGY